MSNQAANKRQRTSTEDALSNAQESIRQPVQDLEKDVEEIFRMLEEEEKLVAQDLALELDETASKENATKALIQATIQEATKEAQAITSLQKDAAETVLHEHSEALRALIAN